jgi:hypothetical protein
MRRAGWATARLALAGFALACGGGEEETRPQTTPMGHSRAQRATDGGENQPPVIERVSLEPVDPPAGSEVRATVKVSDPEGDRVSLAYAWRLDGERLGGDGPAVRLLHAAKGQQLEVRITPSDASGAGEPVFERAVVGNQRPELLGLAVDPPAEVARGASLLVSPHAQDADGDPLEFSYRWTVNGREVAERGAKLSTEGLRRGDEIRVAVVASDGDSESTRLESAPIRVGNSPPKIVSSPGSHFEGGVFRYTLEARDPDGDRGLRFRLLSGPEGMTVDPVLGEIRWKPRRGQAGVHGVDVVVEDPSGGAGAQKFEVTVREEEAEQSPAAQEE